MSNTKVSDVMSIDVSVCRPSDTLDTAARIMWERDCGFVPVVDAAGGLVGAVTDRDLCMAGYIGGAALAETPIARAMAREIVTAAPEEELASVHARLRERGLHRLPVIDEDRRVVGVLSVADLIVAAAGEGTAAARKRAAEQVLETLVAVKSPRRAPEPVKTVAPQPTPRAAVKAGGATQAVRKKKSARAASAKAAAPGSRAKATPKPKPKSQSKAKATASRKKARG